MLPTKFLAYCRTWSHPEIWEEYDLLHAGYSIPSGYKLVEEKDHKKKRLEDKIKYYEREKEYYKTEMLNVDEKLKTTKKELEEIK